MPHFEKIPRKRVPEGALFRGKYLISVNFGRFRVGKWSKNTPFLRLFLLSSPQCEGVLINSFALWGGGDENGRFQINFRNRFFRFRNETLFYNDFSEIVNFNFEIWDWCWVFRKKCEKRTFLRGKNLYWVFDLGQKSCLAVLLKSTKNSIFVKSDLESLLVRMFSGFWKSLIFQKPAKIWSHNV